MDKPEEFPCFGIFAPPPIEMYLPKTKRYGSDVPVRTEPKINRNAICPKCESGLKYKNVAGEIINSIMRKPATKKLRCAKCYRKYKPTRSPRLWNDVTVIRQQGKYVLCKCERCGYVYISQSALAQNIINSKITNN